MTETRTKKRAEAATVISTALLNRWSLPRHDDDGDKEERGRVMIVGGSPEMPGAIMLAATAALRAGAGKLQIAAGASIAQLIAAQIPEARVLALPETKSGGIAINAVDKIGDRINRAQSVLIGPGMLDTAAVKKFTSRLLPLIEYPTLILDAEALTLLSDEPQALATRRGNAVIQPHLGEMAGLLQMEKAAIKREPGKIATLAAERFQCVVALKGATTFITAPGSRSYCNEVQNIGLATSGSGDTLSGIVAGLAARGCDAPQATVWGVYLHSRAGERLSGSIGRVGFLARELLDLVPVLINEFDKKLKKKS